MQETIIYMFISMLVGGVIGGGTNRLAIAMLFRPYRVVRIGGRRLPFTPGLIPKRRKELAVQLGRTVREYLVNGEAIQRTIQSTGVREKMTDWAKSEWEHARHHQRLQQWVHDFIALEEKNLQLERDIRVSDWLSPQARSNLKSRISDLAPVVSELCIRYLASEKGTEIVRKVYSDWTRKQGWVGRLTGTLVDEERATRKSKEWLIHMLAAPQGLDTIRVLLDQGAETVLNWRAKDVLGWIERQPGAVQRDSDGSMEAMIECLVPYILDSLAARSEEWLDLLQLDRLVSEQIETFSLPKLEEMIIRVAKKELRMITWLGALIGGVIGFFQGLIAGLFW